MTNLISTFVEEAIQDILHEFQANAVSLFKIRCMLFFSTIDLYLGSCQKFMVNHFIYFNEPCKNDEKCYLFLKLFKFLS